MASRSSAGLLLYRHGDRGPEILLVHPGGPFWARKDLGAWSMPKGEIEPGEEPLAAAIREFTEETGTAIQGTFWPLGSVTMRSGKIVHAWAVAGDLDPGAIRSASFSMEWPPRSGRQAQFPEVDRAEWFSLDEARRRILPALAPLVDEFERGVGRSS